MFDRGQVLGDSANDTVGLEEEKANSVIPRLIEIRERISGITTPGFDCRSRRQACAMNSSCGHCQARPMGDYALLSSVIHPPLTSFPTSVHSIHSLNTARRRIKSTLFLIVALSP